MDVDLLSLRVFLAVANERSFARAASRLNLSVSATSKHLRRVEIALGGSLVERGPTGVTGLTVAGVRALPEARAVLDAADRMARVVRPGQRGLRTVTIAVAGQATEQLRAAEWLMLAAAVRRRAADVELRVRGFGFDRVVDVVQRGEADICLDTPRRHGTGVELRPLIETSRALVLAASESVEAETVALANLDRLPLLRDASLCPAWMRPWTLRDVIGPSTGPQLIARTASDVARAVAAGVGASVGLMLMRIDPRSGVRLVPLDAPPVTLSATTTTQPDEAVRLVVDVIADMAADLVSTLVGATERPQHVG